MMGTPNPLRSRFGKKHRRGAPTSFARSVLTNALRPVPFLGEQTRHALARSIASTDRARLRRPCRRSCRAHPPSARRRPMDRFRPAREYGWRSPESRPEPTSLSQPKPMRHAVRRRRREPVTEPRPSAGPASGATVGRLGRITKRPTNHADEHTRPRLQRSKIRAATWSVDNPGGRTVAAAASSAAPVGHAWRRQAHTGFEAPQPCARHHDHLPSAVVEARQVRRRPEGEDARRRFP